MSEINFPVVGIGASAGGLKALQEFFDHLPGDTGMAFVVIVHLAPDKSSALDSLLASHTTMKVQQVTGNIQIEPNHIYVISPNKQLRVHENQLLLEEKEKGGQAVVDLFFRSLAEECEKKAIGIVLSGTGTDGTLGLKAIKEYGGIMMAQAPSDASYTGMPISAIDTNLVDFVLPAKELAQKVVEYKEILGKVKLPLHEEKLAKKEAKALHEIFALLSSTKNQDFSQYKRSSVLRRLQRRLYICNCKNISEYRTYVDENPDELNLLFDDLLISVTRFFRDAVAYKKLEKEVIPKLFEDKKPDEPIRIWVVGSATGEEVYSLAILLYEYASGLDYMPQLKIFGTDISDEALSIARKGIYPEAISADISEKRLQRYFHKEEGTYRISKEIRNLVLISKHNILTDPPFVNQDLISCRNLLIYFDKKLQNETLKILHHSLNEDGYLFLGASDSTIAAADYFKPVDKSNGIYKSRLLPESKKEIPLPLMRKMSKLNVDWPSSGISKKNLSLEKIHFSLLAAQYAPPSVIVDDNNQVLHSSSGIDRYLHYTGGEPSRNLLNMVSSQLRRPLQNIIFQFNKLNDPKPVSKKVKVEHQGHLLSIDLQIRPVELKGLPGGFRQIVFEEIEQPSSMHGSEQFRELHKYDESELVQQLEKELEQTREQLRQIIEEYEASNEELMASNEELQSINEELQSTTEELETSKEELQSVNEELKIVNEERELKIEELQSANDDLKNLMDATEIGIIFLNLDLEIKRYTSSTNELFNVIESDLGRSLSHITHQIRDVDLVQEVKDMLKSMKPVKKIVQSTDNRWFIVRIKPYKTTEYKVEGAVLTLMDITDLKHAEELIRKRAENEESLVKLGIKYLQYNDPQKVLKQAANMLKERLNFSHLALLTFNTEQEKLHLQSGYGWPKDQIGTTRIDIGDNSVFDYAINTEKPVVVTDFDDDGRFKKTAWLNKQKIKSGITVLISGSKTNFGILGVYTEEQRSYAKHEVNFLKNTAFRIGEALERIQTEEKLAEINKQLQDKIEIQKQLQQDVLREDKKERWGIGQFLHDEISQNLLAIKLLLESKSLQKKLDENTQKRIEEIKELILESLKNTRELSHFVLPLGGKIGSVKDALNLLVKNTENLYNVECNISSDDDAGAVLNNSISSSVYYIAQEAITNAVKHGKAKKIDIHLSKDDNTLIMIIEDDGIGYNPETDEDGQGINIMKYRAELLGGKAELTRASKDGGTVVKCVLPIEENEH